MMAVRTAWYAMNVNAQGEAEISIFDEIGGWGIGVEQFKESFDLVKGAKAVRLLLNSPGGDVTAGMAMYNLLSSIREKLTVEVLGLAASMASIVALAGKTLVMGEGSFLMIHNPWTVTWGDSEGLRKTADVLDKFRGELLNIYVSRSGQSAEDVAAMMDAETWLTADESVDLGFAHEVNRVAVAAKIGWDFKKIGFNKAPAALAGSNKPQTVREFEAYLRDAGYSANEAKAIVAKGYRGHQREADADQEAVAQALRENIVLMKGANRE
jgi:ATP-dependent Clp endopeptidase proteolytic subunit ClpP